MARRGRWVQLLLDGLDQVEAVGVRATVQEHLGRPPTKAEMSAARRSAHQVVKEGAAVVAHSRAAGDGLHAGKYLVLVRAGAELSDEALRLAAVGRTTFPGALWEQRQESARRAEQVLVLTEGAAELSRQVDVDLLGRDDAVAACEGVGAALKELALLQRRLSRRAASDSQ